ncbi:MAG: four helix bundle protein [Syntrophobacteria bacterium]
MRINSAKELKVYQEAYSLAMEIFELSKQWPILASGLRSQISYLLTSDLRLLTSVVDGFYGLNDF